MTTLAVLLCCRFDADRSGELEVAEVRAALKQLEREVEAANKGARRVHDRVAHYRCRAADAQQTAAMIRAREGADTEMQACWLYVYVHDARLYVCTCI